MHVPTSWYVKTLRIIEDILIVIKKTYLNLFADAIHLIPFILIGRFIYRVLNKYAPSPDQTKNLSDLNFCAFERLLNIFYWAKFQRSAVIFDFQFWWSLVCGSSTLLVLQPSLNPFQWWIRQVWYHYESLPSCPLWTTLAWHYHGSLPCHPWNMNIENEC